MQFIDEGDELSALVLEGGIFGFQGVVLIFAGAVGQGATGAELVMQGLRFSRGDFRSRTTGRDLIGGVLKG